MGHCIRVYLINKSELRNEKINSLLENAESKEIKWTELSHDILATTYIPNVREFGKDKTIAKIITDYFGGSGHQEAKLFVNNKKEYDKSSEFDWNERPINTVLKMMGVSRSLLSGTEGQKITSDEFDMINLGNYRSNKDFNI